MSKIKIFTLTHKDFNEPKDRMYQPLLVGAVSNRKKITKAYLGDDTGDNISQKNCYYSELTGLYYIYKNVRDLDYIGTCHYRRFLVNDQDLVLTKAEIETYLKDVDVITTKLLDLNFTYYYGFGKNHKPYYLDETRKVIADLYPEDLALYDELVNKNHTYFGNIMIAPISIYQDYCKWLFDILFELESRITIQEEDSYHRRIFGFLSEFLWYVYTVKAHLRVKECKVGILSEKAEVAEVKTQVKDFLLQGDFQAAEEFILKARTKRPDIMMEASDVSGELHLCMELVAIAKLEQKSYGRNLLGEFNRADEMIDFCNKLNRQTINGLRKVNESPKDIGQPGSDNGINSDAKTFYTSHINGIQVTPQARFVSEKMFENIKEGSFAAYASDSI